MTSCVPRLLNPWSCVVHRRGESEDRLLVYIRGCTCDHLVVFCAFVFCERFHVDSGAQGGGLNYAEPGMVPHALTLVNEANVDMANVVKPAVAWIPKIKRFLGLS